MNFGSSELNVEPRTKLINQQREQPRHLDSGPLLRTGEGVAQPLGFIRGGWGGGAEGRRGEEGLSLLVLPLS